MFSEDTIFAPATGGGRAALAVIRVSGPQAEQVLRRIAGRLPPPRRASLADLCNPATGEVIDRGLALWFPGPASYTGENCAEFHVHGGRAVLQGMFDALSQTNGVRLAEPGEFTRRAFLNGKADLAAIEGLSDLIEAETQVQRRQALRQMNGVLAAQVQLWRQVLLEARALLEAEIDFADEDEAPEMSLATVVQSLAPLVAEIDQALDSARAGELIREGFSVVLAGPPNAGKSTLLNTIARRDVAIVTEHAGTTRDVLEVRLDLEGVLVILADTAGVRESDDPIESEGISRTRRRIGDSDLVLWLTECGEGEPIPAEFQGGSAAIVPVRTKADLHACDDVGLKISALTGQGMPELLAVIRAKAWEATTLGEPALVTHERHRHALVAARDWLQAVIEQPLAIEVAAEYLRAASRALESLIGRIGVEDVLDEIFAKLCLGK